MGRLNLMWCAIAERVFVKKADLVHVTEIDDEGVSWMAGEIDRYCL